MDCQQDFRVKKHGRVAQMVKCLPAMWETQFRSLGQEDPLEKEMATHFSTLAWKIPWTGAGWTLVHGATELDTTERLHFASRHFRALKEIKRWLTTKIKFLYMFNYIIRRVKRQIWRKYFQY